MTTPRRQPTESSPLLGRSTDSLGSYNSVDDVDSSPAPSVVQIDKISQRDLVWVLAGLYSAVFLGALDGNLRRVAFEFGRVTEPPFRHHRRNTTFPDRQLLQRIQPSFIYRHIVLAFGMLFHAIIW